MLVLAPQLVAREGWRNLLGPLLEVWRSMLVPLVPRLRHPWLQLCMGGIWALPACMQHLTPIRGGTIAATQSCIIGTIPTHCSRLLPIAVQGGLGCAGCLGWVCLCSILQPGRGPIEW